MKRFAGKTVLITGAARGQGRSHAVRLAEEGANILAFDLCRQIDTVSYDMSTDADLEKTAADVIAAGGKIITVQGDVRSRIDLDGAVAAAVTQFGGLDVVIANAAIGACVGPDDRDAERFRDMIDINLTGVWNTVHAAAPTLIQQKRGGAVILISSTQGMTGRGGLGGGALDGYCASKHGIVGLMRTFAHWLAPHLIRVNTVHPTGVPTPMIDNDAIRQFIDDFPDAASGMTNLLPVPLIEERDVSSAIAWLASDEARYVTGIMLPVDAGFAAR